MEDKLLDQGMRTDLIMTKVQILHQKHFDLKNQPQL
jgi:hypothetical protein